MPTVSEGFCRQPDRDAPLNLKRAPLECGYPLPCPHHTVVIPPGGTLTRLSQNGPHTVIENTGDGIDVYEVEEA